MSGIVKICGLSTPETLEAALSAGADMVGFVRFAKSPRHVSLEAGRTLSAMARGRALRVALTVDASDDDLRAVVEAIDPDILQLHGGETPQRVREIAAAFGRDVIKAIGIAEAADVARIDPYRGSGARILIDAKPPPGAELPGGNGRPFDWRLLAALDRTGLDPRLPFMVSGGLDAGNVAEAIAVTGAPAIDVSSGVERAPGVKDEARIAEFLACARSAFGAPRPSTTKRESDP